MKKIIHGLAIVSALTAPAAWAEGGYVGLGLGQSRMNGLDDLCDTIVSTSFSGATTSCSADETDTSVNLFGGYRFNENFAVELGYLDLGESTIDTTITANGASAVISGRTSVSGAYLAGVGILPLGERWSLFGRIGVFGGTAESDISLVANGITLSSEHVEDDGSEMMYGVGAGFSISERIDLRLQFDRIDTDDAIDNLSLALLGTF